MRVHRIFMPAIVILTLLSIVGAAQATGQWIVSGRAVIDPSNMTTSADIKGWMTLQQVADGFGLMPSQLIEIIGLPATISPDTALKDLEAIVPGFEVSTVREQMAIYLGEVVAAPVESIQPTVVRETPPIKGRSTATAIEASQPTPTAATTPSLTATLDHRPSGDGSGPTPLPPDETLAGADIKGGHTLQQISEQAKVALSELLTRLGLPADIDPNTTVRDLVRNGQVSEVQVVRDVVTSLQKGQIGSGSEE